MANPLQQAIQRDYLDQKKGGDGRFSTIKETLNHVGLYAGLIAYTAIGAKVSKDVGMLSLRNHATFRSTKVESLLFFGTTIIPHVKKWFEANKKKIFL